MRWLSRVLHHAILCFREGTYYECVCQKAMTRRQDLILMAKAAGVPDALLPKPLEHREGNERDGFYCWCLPRVEMVEHDYDDGYSWLVVHNDPKAKGGES